MNRNPFSIDIYGKRVKFDLDRVLPAGIPTKALDFGDLRVGIYHEKSECVEILHDEPVSYIRDDGLYKRVIYNYDISNEHISALTKGGELVLVRIISGNPSGKTTLNICGESAFPSLLGKEKAEIIIQENIKQTHYPLDDTTESFDPPRCHSDALLFSRSPQEDDKFFSRISTNPVLARFGLTGYETVDTLPENMKLFKKDKKRPLFGYGAHPAFQTLIVEPAVCNITTLQQQFQTAIQLEWSTIPLYLTSWYTIRDGFNQEAHDAIQNIFIQEMLHMAQAGNLLISIGGTPRIDFDDVTPLYPTQGLPGGVLKELYITLKKLTREHVYTTFMGVEVPQESFVGFPPIINNFFTIGAFYNETRTCMNELGNSIFDPSTADKQLKYNFNQNIGTLHTITNISIANEAITEIVEQGEGESSLNPNQTDTGSYAHFYQFEEIVCENKLEKLSDFVYAYVGPNITYQPDGVWPMVDNPSNTSFIKGTECYNKTLDFHTAYRKTISDLEVAFTIDPNELGAAIGQMFQLSSIAQDFISLPAYPDNPDDRRTCGPVWDYYYND